MNKIYVLSVGPGSPAYLTPAVNGAVMECDLLVGGRRNLDLFADSGKETLEICGRLDSLFAAVKMRMKAEQVGFLVSGDAGIFSILPRLAGRTPVPESQALNKLAVHEASMAIFLSVEKIDEVVKELRAGYSADTPVAVVYKASWPQELVIEGTLADIAGKVKAAGIKLSALVLVGRFLGEPVAESKLYDAAFTHGCREAKE